ncbi:MAG: hypothetical protein ABI625_17560 [bacterium]
MIPIQILRVLSTIQQFDVPALLMGGQACVLYGAAEYSRDLDLAVLATDEGLPRLTDALRALDAKVIAVPPFETRYLGRGHVVHFSIPDSASAPLRVDIMSRMRGVAPFADLWGRRTSITLPDAENSVPVTIELLALEDLVNAKKTQRDKDWPMIRRLVDASYASARDGEVSQEQVQFWLSELRTPEFLREVVSRFPQLALASARPVVVATAQGGDIGGALAAEQASEMAADRIYWAPLRQELEALRHEARRM